VRRSHKERNTLHSPSPRHRSLLAASGLAGDAAARAIESKSKVTRIGALDQIEEFENQFDVLLVDLNQKKRKAKTNQKSIQMDQARITGHRVSLDST